MTHETKLYALTDEQVADLRAGIHATLGRRPNHELRDDRLKVLEHPVKWAEHGDSILEFDAGYTAGWHDCDDMWKNDAIDAYHETLNG